MTKPLDWDESRAEIEALIRAAGNYVHASEDLRPSLLEAARAQRGERRAQAVLRQLAVAVVLLGLFSTSIRDRLDPGEVIPSPRSFFTAPGDQQGTGIQSAGDAQDVTWGLVDSFTELRRRQAEVIRFAVVQPL